MRDNSNKDSEGDQDVITTLKNLKNWFRYINIAIEKLVQII